ncbi:hypothetical protein [Streptomyces sp. NPDC096013]|uniref:hypothetical protein n=1 Tax=Streptomyces sp. NPDC096013 TaxID=3366069 RepID=UPI003816000D
MNRREQLDNQIADMLRAGDTHQDIVDTLHVGPSRVVRVRREQRIPLPPNRVRLTPAQRQAREEQAIALLRDGATYKQVKAATGLQFDRISALRKQHNIPVPDRRPTPGATP